MAETTPYKEKSLGMGILPGIACKEESMGCGGSEEPGISFVCS